MKLYDAQYGDFGPTLAVEKLAEHHGITLNDETLRRWLRGRGIDQFTRRKRPHRAWRVRKAHVGELVQLDGSQHDWLEGRGPTCVLMAYLDDASSRVFARFYEYEGTIPAMDSFQRAVQRYGLPLALYADKPTTYRSPAEPTVAEQLAGTEQQSQFGRVLRELVVELIAAHSHQAKGRVERLFRTFQDRLIKELRLAGVTTLEEANRFLEGYLPRYNRQFVVPPVQTAYLHRPPPTVRDLERSVCLKTTRCLRKDFTIVHEGRLYQIHDTVRATHVQVEERLDGTLQLTHQGRRLAYHVIAARPQQQRGEGTPVPSPQRPVRPRLDHPWLKRWGRNEDHTWRRPEHNPDISKLG